MESPPDVGGPKGEPGPHGPQGERGAPGVSGVELLVQTSAATSADKELAVTCEVGKIAIGGGAQVMGGTSTSLSQVPTGVAIVASYPTGLSGEKSDTWRAAAKEVIAVTATWRLSVHVVCADATD